MTSPLQELIKLLILPQVVRWWRYWIVSLGTIKYGSAKRMKRRQASSLPSAPFATSECPKVCATFCGLTKAALKDQVGKNVLSYIDDIFVANRKKETYISDLAETFTNMREARLKLNPEKCIFGITKGKVLCYLVSTKGIGANPDKIRAIIQMQPPHSRKHI
jgi:hypothetical protein